MQDYIYSDINSHLKVDSTGNYKVEYDADAVIQSVKNIFSTISGERVRNPIGSSLIRFLFQPMSSDTADDIKDLIIQNIREYEPRVERLSVTVRGDKQNQLYEVNVNFTINRFKQPFSFQTNLRAMS